MIRIIISFLILFNICYSQSSTYGLESWYFSETLATAGGVGALPNGASDRINPAGFANIQNQFQFGVNKYPAGINAQGAQLIKSINNSTIGISLRHLSYGNFTVIDENGFEDGSYSAGDTWISATLANGESGFSKGISGGIFISNLESYTASAMIFSAGVLYDYSKKNSQFGLSASNFGIVLRRYTDQKELLPSKLIASANKKLTHLPLDLNVDLGYYVYTGEVSWRFGGIFSLPYNVDILFGINSNNIDQRTEYSSIKSVLGSSGIGIAYMYKRYNIKIGGYTFGSGGWIYGTDLSILL